MLFDIEFWPEYNAVDNVFDSYLIWVDLGHKSSTLSKSIAGEVENTISSFLEV